MKIPYCRLLAIPLLLVFSGACSNQLVLVANWGKFPVMVNEQRMQKIQKENCEPQDMDNPDGNFSIFDTSVLKPIAEKDAACAPTQFIDEEHSIMGKNSRLKFLADYLSFGSTIYSPGDFLILLGEWLFSYTWIIWGTLVFKDALDNAR